MCWWYNWWYSVEKAALSYKKYCHKQLPSIHISSSIITPKHLSNFFFSLDLFGRNKDYQPSCSRFANIFSEQKLGSFTLDHYTTVTSHNFPTSQGRLIERVELFYLFPDQIKKLFQRLIGTSKFGTLTPKTKGIKELWYLFYRVLPNVYVLKQWKTSVKVYEISEVCNKNSS